MDQTFPMQHSHIIAMGGGGFSMEPDNLRLDHYILEKAGKPNPIVCFVPTAGGDADEYIGRFYQSYRKLPCRPRHLPLFKPPTNIAACIGESDVIYVGGGNTRNMLAIWREWGVDLMLWRAWEKGTLLCGLSAGAICWFEHGVTDSAGPLAPMRCLGFLSGTCVPHYDAQTHRRPAFHDYLRQGKLSAGYGLDDGAAAYFVGGKATEFVSSRPHARAFHVQADHGHVTEEALHTRLLPAP